MSVHPAKTQISLGIRPVWSESSLSTWRKLGSLATHWAHSEDWSNWADGIRPVWSGSLLGALSFCWFCHVTAHLLCFCAESLFLPFRMSSLSELNVSANDLQDLPPSLGLLRYLRTLYADENLLEYIPAELGSCSGITVLSLRSNKLTYIPDELGRIPRLRVLNLSSNQLECLPFSFIKLKQLQALWLSENQVCWCKWARSWDYGTFRPL